MPEEASHLDPVVTDSVVADSVVTPAATVVPLRDSPSGPEVLMLRRNMRGQFGGMWVFPGGQVDAGDRTGPADGGPATAEEEMVTARRAAVREAREEAGIELDPSTLVALSFWLPPPGAQRRFATWFFLAPAEHVSQVVVDDQEVREHRWLTPASAMAARDQGEIDLAAPTFTTLWWLTRRADAASALQEAGAAAPERFESHIARTRDGLIATLWSGDTAYEDGEVERLGRRRRLIMDPAGWRVEIDG